MRKRYIALALVLVLGLLLLGFTGSYRLLLGQHRFVQGTCNYGQEGWCATDLVEREVYICTPCMMGRDPIIVSLETCEIGELEGCRRSLSDRWLLQRGSPDVEACDSMECMQDAISFVKGSCEREIRRTCEDIATVTGYWVS